MKAVGLLLLALCLGATQVHGQGCAGGSCFPSTGNLLVGRGHMLNSSSTCGQRGPEPYCIVSHLKDVKKCFTCDSEIDSQAHPIQNVITTFDDDETWWQSEHGRQNVVVQLDLEAEFQFTHTIMIFKTFRPAAMFIERSMDFGENWAIYRYFASDCERSFPDVPIWPPKEVDQVVCDSRYSAIEPSEGGEVIFRVLEPFIAIDDPYAPRIQNLLKITNLRYNFTELHTLGDDLLDNRRDIKNKYYYSLKELIVRGNCFCYGHADSCSPIEGVRRPDEETSKIMNDRSRKVHGRCECQHNTMGLNCELCKPFYQDQPWRPAEEGKPHECKQCNCNLHSEQCHFDAARFAQTGERSGGICDNCRHHTTGPNCEQCLPFFYMDPNRDITDPDVCVACDCELAGSLNGGVCDGITDSRNGLTAGQCRCKSNVDGARCDRCRDGYFGLNEENPDGCSPCDCDSLGTLGGGNTCDPYTGQCTCKRYTTGRRCDQCLPQTWGMSAIPNGCTECDCDIGGAYKDSCELVSGQCDCRPNIEGRRCDVVVPGFFLPGLDYYVFEAEDGDYSGSIEEAKDYREHRPPVTWTGDGFLMVQEDNSVTFIVRDLPQSRNYDLVLRYQTNMPQDWQYVEVEIDRPNRGNIPTSSPCGNTMPNDDSWVVSLPGPPATFHSLGIICLEENYTYRIKVDFKRYQQNSGYDDPTPDILIDSLVVVPLYQDLYMFQSSVEGHERAKMFEDLGCQDDEMIMPNRDPGRDCASLMFSMSAVVHDGAQDCGCDPHGSLSSTCDPWNGQCVCQQNVIGRKCDRCAPGTYGFSPEGCRPCECDMQGSLNQFCDDKTGKCTCRPRVTGRTCDKCLPGYFQFPQCMTCSCNGHADTCTPDYGVCINCRDHTVGEHCEMCENGYYGSPLLGSDDQCRPCMCPDGPNSNRQFATGCRKDEFSSRVVCFCKPGYTGSRCDQCASSYWGNPQDSNGICRKCDCSGNVDESDENACDADTGICTGCLYNTAGIHCERCRDFYYGSASERTCTSCSCNSDGTLDSTCVGDDCRCDAGTGQCQCLPRVAGRRCDQCEPNHWNLESGTGCETCNCNLENSKGPSCDEFTGQCQCNEGFGGRTCDGCADGFYGDPNVQCFACECDMSGSTSSICDGRTGQCPCVDGVGGRRCDRCQRGHTGEVPHCEPCGECFDNWDKIIMDLNVRAETVAEKARQIGETGITGAYDKEFKLIAEMLKKISEGYDSQKEDGLNKMIIDIDDKLTAQEKRINDLKDSMEKILIEDAATRADLVKLNTTKNDAADLLDILKMSNKQISHASPIAAMQQIEEYYRNSVEAKDKARADTLEDGSLVEQSQEIRAAVAASVDDKLQEVNDNLEQTKSELADVKEKVDEITLSELNEDVCGRATETCDDTCGGAGCETCGGGGCAGAVDFSKEALDRSQRTQDILHEKAQNTSNLLDRVQEAKQDAKMARENATRLREKAEEVERRVREKNKKIKDLIADIRNFLKDERANPNEIQTLVDKINELSLPVDRQQIQQLADDIRDLSDKLPEVDDVLDKTKEGLDIAKKLQDDANQARNEALAVKSNVESVQNALQKAEEASANAEMAKAKAEEDVEQAGILIQSIKETTSQIEEKMGNITERLNNFDERLKAAEHAMTDNKLTVNDTLSEAQGALSTAEGARDLLAENSDLLTDGQAKLNKRKNQTERIERLKNRTNALLNKITTETEEVQELQTNFERYEKELQAKNDRLLELIAEVDHLYAEINKKERWHRICS